MCVKYNDLQLYIFSDDTVDIGDILVVPMEMVTDLDPAVLSMVSMNGTYFQCRGEYSEEFVIECFTSCGAE